jgi:hypothetical protein
VATGTNESVYFPDLQSAVRAGAVSINTSDIDPQSGLNWTLSQAPENQALPWTPESFPKPQESSPVIKSAQTTKSKLKIPRPPNAFILYRARHQQEVKDKNPGIKNNDICESLGV